MTWANQKHECYRKQNRARHVAWSDWFGVPAESKKMTATNKQKPGETDQHYYDRCREADNAELDDCKCKRCGKPYETDGENDNGLCFDCDNALRRTTNQKEKNEIQTKPENRRE